MLAERQPARPYPLAYQAGGAQVIADGELGLGTVEQIERTAADALERCPGMIVVDLTAASRIDDVPQAGLLAALRRLRRRGASVAIVAAEPHARNELDAAALKGLTFTMTAREALRALEPVAHHPGGPPPRRPTTPAARRRQLPLSPGGEPPIPP